MSLHNLAHHVKSAGRGEDTMLVHMTPKEVQGLQKLAVSHGGSLTINPKTGLPEAGFLSAILPMVAGFALGPAGMGLTAMQAGLAVGAVGTVATGSLGKGLMAGFGAYGGAGLGQGLMTAGESALGAGAAPGSTAANLGNQGSAFGTNLTAEGMPLTTQAAQTTAQTTAETAAQNAIKQGGIGNYTGYQGYNGPAAGSAMNQASAAWQAPTSSIAPADIVGAPNYRALPLVEPNNAIQAVNTGGISSAPTLDLNAAKAGLNTAGAGQTYGSNVAEQMRNTATPVNDIDAIMRQGTPASNMDKVGAGFKDVTSSGTKAWDFVKAHPAPFIGAGLGLAQDLMDKKDGAPTPNQGMIRPYTLSRTQRYPQGGGAPVYGQPFDSSERTYFDDKYTAGTPYKAPGPEYAAEGGLMGMAAGGATLALPDRPPIEQASVQQAIGANNTYPMANQRSATYSAPFNRPLMHEVIDPSGGPEVDPYTGEPRFASGGATSEQDTSKKFTYNPKTMQYTDVTPAPVVDQPSRFFGGMSGMGGGFTGMLKKATTPATAVPASPVVSGGIASPVGQMQQPQQTQQMQPTNIPAYQSPEQQLGLGNFYDYMNQQLAQRGGYQSYANGGMAQGASHLGSYSDGGRLLKGPGDGVSDSIPAVIGRKQPARLADGEFVIPARIVSELGNGSTDAGAKRLYAMMDRVQKARGKTTGKNKVAVNSKADKFLPA